MLPTTDNDLLGGPTKKSKKAAKAAAKSAKPEKAPKAAKAPKAEKPAKAPKAEKAPKVKRVKLTDEEKAVKKAQKKAERKAARGEKADDRVAVDQTPTKLTRPHNLKAPSIELLIHLHEKVKEPTSMAEIAVQLKTDTKTVAGRAKSLIEAGLVVKDEKAKTLDIVGKRQDGLTELLKAIAKLGKANGSMPTSAKVGQELWADPKKPGKKDSVRYGRAAGRVLQGAWRMGIIDQFTQPRRKFSDTKLRKLFAVIEA